MYKRKQKAAPSYLSLSSKSMKTDRQPKPPTVCEVVVEVNNENNPGNANDDEDEDDLFEIPASQQAVPTTQRRYFSQRSNNAANRSQTTSFTAAAAGTSARRVPSSFFENTLLRCGVIFDNPQYIVLGCDHINFVNKLRTMLQVQDHPENIDRFVSGLREYIKDEQQMLKVLTVCMINVPNCDFLPQSQDCLMRNFLMIECLEQKIVELLLDTLTNISSESNPTDQNVCSAILILTQLGFVNKVNNAEAIFKHIVALLGLTEDIFRNEIIKFLPEIVDVKKHDSIVERIISLMGSDPHKYLNEVTVNSFEAMQLSLRLRSQLKTRILTYIQQEDAPMKLYPTFTKFLLNCHPSENLIELITRFRKIDWTDVDNEDWTQVNDTQKEVFQFILRALKRSKELGDAWLKSILGASRAEDCYPSDLVVLILMSSLNEDRSMYLEMVLRRKLKSGWMTRETFSRGITGFPLVIAQHLKVFFEFIDNLFRMKEDLFEFGEIGYKLAFGIPNCDHKLLLSKLIAFVCERNSDYVVRRALMLLKEICDEHPEEVQKNSLQILRILDKVNDVGLFEYRLIMELLSSIAYPPPPALPVDGIASHIDIMVRKQVTGSGNNVRRQGIVGSVRVIDHLVWYPDEASAVDDRDTDASIESVEMLPNGNSRTAGKALSLMLVSSEQCPFNRALCYDELASALCPRMITSKTNKFLNRPFLAWCHDITCNEFQELFTVETIPNVPGITLGRHFRLNRLEEYTEDTTQCVDLAINIAGLVFAENYKTRPTIATLSPLFSLLRILTFHQSNGDLVSIDAVLGCPVIFPQFINSPEELDMEDPEKSVLLMDILFYTANWFREVVCAFSSQRTLNIRRKVLMRLSDLIALEENIRTLLRALPAKSNYCPPKCQFMTTDRQMNGDASKRVKGGGPVKEKKRRTPNESLPNNSTLMEATTGGNDSTLGNQSKTTTDKEVSKRSSSAGCYGPKEVYRQLDPDIMHLLTEALCTSYPMPRDQMGHCLGLAEYQFIVEDLILKLESVTGVKKSSGGFQQDQFVIFEVALVVDMEHFLARFMHFFSQFTDAIQRNQELQANESSPSDACLFSDEMNQLKRCFGLTLRLFGALFSWQGFHQEKHKKLLKRSLLLVLGTDGADGNGTSVKSLCNRVIDSMVTRVPFVLDLFSAVQLYHLIVALSSFTSDYSKSVQLCEQFLGRKWHAHTGAVERGGEANTLLNELLKGLFRNVQELKPLKKQIGKTLEEIQGLNGKEMKLKSFPNFNKANFPILFRALANSIYEFTVGQLERDLSTLMQLELWERVYDVQNGLLQILQAVKVPRNFTLYLKYSQLILKLFLQTGMPAVEASFKAHSDRVIALIKSVQQTTRFLHTLCCHSKSVKATGIIALIPGLRQLVESFNYSVKAALVANKCSSAFESGNLKNKDMDGVVLLSQVVSLSGGADEEEGDEELFPSDDETVEGGYLGITTMCAPSAPPSAAVAKGSRRKSSRTSKGRK